MSSEDFLTESNTDTLWEVIIENDNVPKNKQTQDTFVRLLPEFYKREKQDTSVTLIEMNKHFISLIINKLSQNRNTKAVNTTNAITNEDIKKERQSVFEEQFNQRQQEFTSAMKINTPDEPNFRDNRVDEPLENIESIIEKTIAERNLEINKIQYNTDKTDAHNWLTSTDTSLKDEKQREKEQALKMIKIEKDDLVSVIPSEDVEDLNKNKQITWGKDTHIENRSPDMSIFSKLKSKSIPNTNDMTIEKLYNHINMRFDKLEELLNNLQKQDDSA